MTRSSSRVVSTHLEKTTPDQYGQQHPLETPELIASSLSLLDDELSKLPNEERAGLDAAEEKYPSYAKSEEHRLMFLRCEMFNADLAADRLAKYWNRRIELFGDRAFSPLTLNGALKEDEVALSMGFVQLVPGKDEVGRAIILSDPSRLDETMYTRESMVRATWYVLHAALEDESVQQKGCVFIVYNRHTRYHHFDRVLSKMCAESIRGILPLRAAGFHMCHPKVFFNLFFPLVKVFLGTRLRKRIHVHSGSDKVVLEKLAKCGMAKEHLPTELAGGAQLDQAKWIAKRSAEGK